MPEHIPPGGLHTRREHGHGNRWHVKSERTPPQRIPTVRKVDVSTVPEVFNADMVSRNGRTVWAAFDGEQVVGVAATADEARKKWRTYMAHKGEREARAKREKR